MPLINITVEQRKLTKRLDHWGKVFGVYRKKYFIFGPIKILQSNEKFRARLLLDVWDINIDGTDSELKHD